LIRYRSFRNSDPPAIADIWRTHPPSRGLMQPMSASLLDSLVLAKPYFDRHGLILADDDGRPVGFVHAGFGPNEDFSNLATQRGVTCMLMVSPHPQRETIARELVAQSEDYLRRGGARELYGGGVYPLTPFYLGLYGGSELPGVLASDAAMCQLYTEAGYTAADQCIVLERDLHGFRPAVDRRRMQVRRQYNVEATVDPPPANWWEACTWGQTDHTRFEVLRREGGPSAGSAMFWEIEPLASSWGVHAMGLVALQINASLRRQGLATFLVGEAMRQLQQCGVTRIQVQVMQPNAAARGLYAKLGFTEIDRGVVYRKQA
jgi:ribosomal protein S18 acetylase RimI-like enzyme